MGEKPKGEAPPQPEQPTAEQRQARESALEAIERGNFSVEMLEQVDPAQHQEIALELTAHPGYRDWLMKNLEAFRGLDYQAVVDKFLESGYGASAVARHLDKFPDQEHSELVDKIIAAGHVQSLIFNLDKVRGLDHREIVDRLIEAGEGETAVFYLDSFQDLDYREVADNLFRADVGYLIAQHLEKFPGLDHRQVALTTIGCGSPLALLQNLEKFQGLDQNEIANLIMDKGWGATLANNIGKLPEANHKAIADRLIESGEGLNCRAVAEYLGKFRGLDHREIANKLIKAGYSNTVIDNIENFRELGPEVAAALIDDNPEIVLQHLSAFRELDWQVAKRLVDLAKHIKGVAIQPIADNIDSFRGSFPRFLAKDMIDYCVENEELDSAVKLNDRFHADGHLAEASGIFGQALTPEVYAMYRQLSRGLMPTPEAMKLGVTKTGEEGINQLKEILAPDDQEPPAEEPAS